MPVYEYRCDACNQEFEMQRKFSDPPLDVCPQCGKGPVEKLISRSASFALKGGGWYSQGYASSGAPTPSCPNAGSKSSCSGCSGSSD